MRIGRILATAVIVASPAIVAVTAMPRDVEAAASPQSTAADRADHQANVQEPSRKQVARLQLSLARSGHMVAVDGIWGRKTTEALRAFQKDRGLRVTGFNDAATMKALSEVE